MIKAILATTLVLASLSATTKSADACSIRGNWCSYPLWAANAFEDPFDRVNPRTRPILLSDEPRPVARKYNERRRVVRRDRPAR